MNQPPPVPAGASSFLAADRELETTLDNLDDAGNYRNWIFDLVAPALGPTVLEVGAGHGTFTELLAAGRSVVATDLSPRCAAVLEERFASSPSVTVVQGDLTASRSLGPFHSAVMINVLEHIEDDGAALRELAGQLLPGGRLALWVPAHQRLYSDFDRSIGHFRRYSLPEVSHKLEAAGYRADTVKYVNAVGALAWWLVARKLRRIPTKKLGVTVFDRFAVPPIRRVESHYSVPFGQSILALCTRR